MKEKIYTIPVNDGFNENSECAFCSMAEKLEEDALNYTLGPSYMEQDVRDMTNEKGFCKSHYIAMYKAQNRLGLSLMVSTHMAEIQNRMTELLKEERKEKKGGLFKKTEESALSDYVRRLEGSCFVCSKIEASMERYFDTFFYLWKRDSEFRERFKACKGFCTGHFERLVRLSSEKLGKELKNEFLDELEKVQTEGFMRVHEELLWFISKFDYRFHDRPWGNSKDSLSRAILKTASLNPEKEFDIK